MLTIEKLVMNTQMVDRDCRELDDKYFGQDVYNFKSKLGKFFLLVLIDLLFFKLTL